MVNTAKFSRRWILWLAAFLVAGVVITSVPAPPAAACPAWGGRVDEVGGEDPGRCGDTLNGIAAAHGSGEGTGRRSVASQDVLASPDEIYSGQRLDVRPSGGTPAKYRLMVAINQQVFADAPITQPTSLVFTIIKRRFGEGGLEIRTQPSTKPLNGDMVFNLSGLDVTVIIATRSSRWVVEYQVFKGEQLVFKVPTNALRPGGRHN